MIATGDTDGSHAQDITVGRPICPQLAKTVFTPQEAITAMKGQPFLLETKFDGESVNSKLCAFACAMRQCVARPLCLGSPCP